MASGNVYYQIKDVSLFHYYYNDFFKIQTRAPQQRHLKQHRVPGAFPPQEQEFHPRPGTPQGGRVFFTLRSSVSSKRNTAVHFAKTRALVTAVIMYSINASIYPVLQCETERNIYLKHTSIMYLSKYNNKYKNMFNIKTTR